MRAIKRQYDENGRVESIIDEVFLEKCSLITEKFVKATLGAFYIEYLLAYTLQLHNLDTVKFNYV